MFHKVEGYFKLEAVNVNDGSKRLLADWFPNLITNIGLDRMALEYDFLDYCQVGTGSTTPAYTDIALVSRVGSTNSYVSRNGTVNSTSPYYRSYIWVYRFGAGVATGNLSEVGVGWASSGSLFSRALIVDSYGNPTTITVLSDEYLDVTYENRFYLEESDVTGNITFTGNIGGTYSYTLRPARIAIFNGTQWTSYGIHPCPMSNCGPDHGYTDIINRVYDGSIGPITSMPSGNYLDISLNVIRNISYTSGTHSITLNINLGLADGNLAGGIKSMVFLWGRSHYQIEFGTAIPKTSVDTLSLTFTHTWGRV